MVFRSWISFRKEENQASNGADNRNKIDFTPFMSLQLSSCLWHTLTHIFELSEWCDRNHLMCLLHLSYFVLRFNICLTSNV